MKQSHLSLLLVLLVVLFTRCDPDLNLDWDNSTFPSSQLTIVLQRVNTYPDDARLRLEQWNRSASSGDFAMIPAAPIYEGALPRRDTVLTSTGFAKSNYYVGWIVYRGSDTLARGKTLTQYINSDGKFTVQY